MNSFISKWGNSAALRISAPVLGQAGFRVGECVTVRAEAGRIVLEKADPKYDLDTMLMTLTPENSHDLPLHARAVGAEQIEW